MAEAKHGTVITVASWPPDLSTWDPTEQPFYLEFIGESNPILDETYAEVIPAEGTDPKAIADAPVYEYWWTLGHPGAAEHNSHWYDPAPNIKPVWENLADPAARVYLYFPISGGWRIREIVATVKYLSPLPEERSWLRQGEKDLAAAQPALGAASQIAGLIPAAGTASKWLDTISKLQVTSVPQSGDFNWSVGKVTFGSLHGAKQGVMQGVMWTLPRPMFQRLGGRLTGSLALSVLPAARKGVNSGPVAATALAHAVIYESGGATHWIPDEPPEGRGFVEMTVTPRKKAQS